jgi:hypothetical protein
LVHAGPSFDLRESVVAVAVPAPVEPLEDASIQFIGAMVFFISEESGRK